MLFIYLAKLADPLPPGKSTVDRKRKEKADEITVYATHLATQLSSGLQLAIIPSKFALVQS